MIIQTERLTLRPFEKTDITWYYDLVQHPDVAKWLCDLDSSDRSIVERHVDIFSKGNMKDDFYYVITNNNQEVLGFIIAIRLILTTIDASYFLKEEYRHKGYMNEALKALVPAIRKVNPYYRIRMEVDKENVASLNVVKKLNSNIVDKENKYMCWL